MASTKRPFNWVPTPDLIAQSNLTAFLHKVGESSFDSLSKRADADPAWLMREVFEFCDFRFYRPYTQMLDTSRGIEWARWCVGGTTNIVLNCLDRHRGTPAWEQTFLVWEGEDPQARRRSLSYREFDAEVCRLASALQSLGVGPGDRVGLYLPNLPETFIAFFAVLKIGAILMPLFSGFGPQPLVSRLNDCEAKVVLTVDGTWRRGSAAAMKSVLDEALRAVPSVAHVLVLRHLGEALACPMTPGRDHDWATLVASRPADHPTAEMAADAPAVLLYTSGTTGKPKGCVWTHVSFLGSMVTRDMHICADFKSSDRFFFMSDMGWMVGAMCACIPSYFGGSLLVAEGAPDYPDTGRFWRLLQDHRVTYVGVAPTLIRGLMRYGDKEVDGYDLSSLRITCSGGEAWTEAPWRWFFEHVCKSRLPFLNIVGGTEVGGCNFTSTLHHPVRPGSFGGGGLGVGADIVDESGRPVGPGQVGELVLRNPNIGFTKSLWRDDDERYLDSYWRIIPGIWVHGDFAMRDEDGLFYILGRSDDTIKVSGKRTGPSEIETLLANTGKISEAAVIGVPDELKGSAIVCVCVPMPGVPADEALQAELSRAVVAGMGTSYRPRQVLLVSDLPKTRNMKIMRRVVRAVYRGESPGDLSALVNPEAVAELQGKLGG
ncbi:MAG: AMP-dependent synthetase [Betaproteobacteria bacterium]|nr:MAG: AMP-dependent synthetase [Betaproteobacteria bacterium]